MSRFRRRRATNDARASTSENPPVVLGAQLAAAHAQEAKVRAENPDLPSPVGRQYDFWKGEQDLARFVESSLDDEIRALVAGFDTADVATQDAMRTALTIDDLYTVLQFSRRASLASLRRHDVNLARHALLTIALVDVDRVDWRDVPGPLELAAYAVKQTGGDLPSELAHIRAISIEKIGSMIERLQDSTIEPSPKSAGFALVTTSHGIGLLDCWFGGAASTALASLLVALADAVDQGDDYRSSSITLSADIPSVWFPKPARERAERITDSVRAAGSINARRRSGRDSVAQQFTVFVADVGSAEHASQLLELATSELSTGHAALAIARDSIFLLLIARSFVQGVEGVETSDTLERFRGPFTAVLEASSP